MVHGNGAEVLKAKELLGKTRATRVDNYSTITEHAVSNKG
jgi:hypothetical protein